MSMNFSSSTKTDFPKESKTVLIFFLSSALMFSVQPHTVTPAPTFIVEVGVHRLLSNDIGFVKQDESFVE